MKLLRALPLPLLALTALAACGDKEGDDDDTGDTSGAVDADGDGFDTTEDCDDADADVNPDAAETCDGLDNDCNGEIDDGVASTFYVDADGDGFGGTITIEACEAPDGFVADNTDCDDLDAAISPDGTEVCDGVDNDCDGSVDDDDDSLDTSTASTFYQDDDGDGYGQDDASVAACEAPDGYTDAGGDCDDADADANPDTMWYSDVDGDGYGSALYTTTSCEQPSGYVADSTDCDDLEPNISPAAAEVCDAGVDNDCDGLADDDDDSLDASTLTDFYPDSDGDGWGDGDGAVVSQCAAPSGYTPDIGDCDDGAADVNPDATEVCNDGVDNDCDGTLNSCGLDATLLTSAADHTLTGPSDSNLGYDLAFGDLNGDGVTDLVVPGYYDSSIATGSSAAGNTFIVYGGVSGDMTFSTDEDASFSGSSTYDYAGKAVSAGDLDADGYDDLLVSAYGADAGGSGSGSVYLVYGGASAWSGNYTLSDSADAEWTGASSSDYLGTSLKVVGDIDGDGYEDFAMGGYGVDIGGTTAGAVYLMFGDSTRLTGGSVSGADVTIAGGSNYDYLGDLRNISSAADTDGDGMDDLIVSATSADPGGRSSAGAVYLFSGDSSLSGSYSTGDADAQFEGSSSSDYLGEGVTAGDLDGDGYDDIVAGADGQDGGATSAGAVYVWMGGSTQFSGSYDADATADVGITGLATYDYLGEGVATGDVDADGIDDLLLGADGVDGGSTYSVGGGYLFYGGSLGGVYSAASADSTIVVDSGASYGYGGQALYIEDTNGDGSGDVWFPSYGEDFISVFNGGGL